MNDRYALRLGVVFIAAAFTLGACGGSSSIKNSGSGGGPAATSPGAGATMSTGVKACLSMLPRADAERIIGKSLSDMKRRGDECDYLDPSATKTILWVENDTSAGDLLLSGCESVADVKGTATNVTGVGDKACEDDSNCTYVQAKTNYFRVCTVDDPAVTADIRHQLANVIISHIPWAPEPS